MAKERDASKAVANMIYIIRGHKVMLDLDPADFYGVPTKNLES